MTAKAAWYANGILRMMGKHIDLVNDALKMMLLTGYSVDLVAHALYSDVSASEITGTGYTAGGVAVSGNAITATAANSWGTTWAANTAYSLGQIVKPITGNGYAYRCSVAGTS